MKALRIGTKDCDIEIITVDNELRTYQALVGGLIECAYIQELKDQNMVLICNEEGLLAGLPFNKNLYPFFFVGQVVLVGIGYGDFEGLTDEQIEYAMTFMTNLYLMR